MNHSMITQLSTSWPTLLSGVPLHVCVPVSHASRRCFSVIVIAFLISLTGSFLSHDDQLGNFQLWPPNHGTNKRQGPFPLFCLWAKRRASEYS
jgi:hypothetical protein